ncbi:transposase [Dehalococcoidia bacterium]|nr:transposase [Dehalococcoidia bacterium]
MERIQRRLSAEEKLRVVEEERQSGASISEVCRRHQIAHTQFYRWERLARQGALEALRNGQEKPGMASGRNNFWLRSHA